MDNRKGEVLEVRCCEKRQNVEHLRQERTWHSKKKKILNVLEWLEIKEDVGDSWKLSQE